jgi:hypothetical protein
MQSDIASFADVLAVKETKKAIACVPLGRTTLFWVPKSQFRPDTQVAHIGDSGALIVSRWSSSMLMRLPS